MVFIVRGPAPLSRPDTGKKVIKAADFWAFKQAEDAVADGMRRHDEIIRDAQAAFLAEQQRGYRAGTEAARLEQAGNMMEIVGHTVEYFAKIECQMVDLVLDAVRRIVTDYDDRQQVLAVVRNSLALMRSQKHLTLRVHPDQVEVIRSQLDQLRENSPAINLIDVVEDCERKLDECIIESDIGRVEASMSGQLETLRATFAKVFGGQQLHR